MTNWIIGPRQSGRSTELIEQAAATDLLILTGDANRANILAKMAKDLGLKIRQPTPFYTWLRQPHRFFEYKDTRPGILLDDADFVLECMLQTSVIYAVVTSGDYVHKSILEDMGIEV